LAQLCADSWWSYSCSPPTAISPASSARSESPRKPLRGGRGRGAARRGRRPPRPRGSALGRIDSLSAPDTKLRREYTRPSQRPSDQNVCSGGVSRGGLARHGSSRESGHTPGTRRRRESQIAGLATRCGCRGRCRPRSRVRPTLAASRGVRPRGGGARRRGGDPHPREA
jgi:hypothetical protein